MEKLRRLFLLVLLLPVFPVVALSPFSHAYVNRLALKRAKAEKENGNRAINEELLQLVLAHEDEFINAGNSADAISTYHILNGIDLYDYAHNSHPDNARGVPLFGYALVDEWNGKRSEYPESHLAIAAGWLAHQLADWYPHYACVKGTGELSDDPSEIADDCYTFAGFANALTIFGADLPEELRGRYKVPNHGLYELFLDVAVMAADENKEFYGIKVNLFNHTIIFGMGLLIRFLLRACPDLRIRLVVRLRPASRGRGLSGLSMNRWRFCCRGYPGWGNLALG